MTADRCNKPLPGGRFACSREAGHNGRCLRSVFSYPSREDRVFLPPAQYDQLDRMCQAAGYPPAKYTKGSRAREELYNGDWREWLPEMKESVTVFKPGAALYAPHPRGPWMTEEEYDKRYRSLPRYMMRSDRAVVTGVDRENGVVTVSSAPKEIEER